MKFLQQLTFGLILSFCAGSVLALDAINTPWFSNVAIEGYDPVAYFLESKPVAGIEPEQWSIVDGKLYLNYNAKVKGKWLVDTTRHIVDGDKNWPGLLTSN